MKDQSRSPAGVDGSDSLDFLDAQNEPLLVRSRNDRENLSGFVRGMAKRIGRFGY
jgi:hypothetical protein